MQLPCIVVLLYLLAAGTQAGALQNSSMPKTVPHVAPDTMRYVYVMARAR